MRLKDIIVLLNSWRFIFHYLLLKSSCEGSILLRNDLKRYDKSFFYLMTFEKTFRNLFYARLGLKSFPLMLLAPRESSLRIDHIMKLGGGVCLVHNYWTYLHARNIGDNFTCLHGVTIGNYSGLPTIGNNVSVFAGACITGDIRIGNNVKIGAGCVISTDVPNNCTVIGNPAFISRLNGQKVSIPLPYKGF